MALSKFIRIFFGHLYSQFGTAYAVAGQDDTWFPDFLTGISVGGSGAIHTRIPPGNDGHITSWDEYLDLHSARVNAVRPEDMLLYKDLAGIEFMHNWSTSGQYAQLPTNSIAIECETLMEWLKPTQRLTYPLVDDPLKPIIAPNANGDTVIPVVGNYPWPALADANSAIMRLYFRLARDMGGGVFEYSDPVIVDAPFNTAAPAQFSAWNVANPNAFDAYLVSYRAKMISNNMGGSTVEDFPKLNAGYLPPIGAYSQLIPANSGLQLQRLEHLFDDTRTTILDRPALNNAIARMNFDYEHRHRIDTVTGLPTQLMLVLNTEKYKYYKGVPLSISPFFTTGVGKRTEDGAIIQLQVVEEGVFTDATLLDPSVGLTAQYNKTQAPV